MVNQIAPLGHMLKRGYEMFKLMKIGMVVLFLSGGLYFCDAQSQKELYNALLGQDCSSPTLLKFKATKSDEVTLCFDEFINCSLKDFRCLESSNSIVGVSCFESELKIKFSRSLRAGQREIIEARVTDLVGNSLSFTVGIWGLNDNLPKLLINEFTTKGSGNNPDRVELIVLEGGDLAGVTLYDGLAQNFDSECILPSYRVNEGDYVVIEYSEALRGAHPIEFWAKEVGLGANNGVISLYDTPDGEIIDAVLYTNRGSTQYNGFGTKKVEERALLLEELGHWNPIPIDVESGINSTDSTATRSMCRIFGKEDTNSKADWYIVPTGKASFGSKNVVDHYLP
ncbi:MAG: hypothetical protein WDA17_06795 [Sphaerochaetaceae bacterium]